MVGDGERRRCGGTMKILGSMYAHMLEFAITFVTMFITEVLANQQENADNFQFQAWVLHDLFELPFLEPWNTPTPGIL